MKHVGSRCLPILSAVIMSALLSGCAKETEQPSVKSASTSKPAPEASFELIVETFRRGVEDVPIGFVVRQERGHSMMVGRNEVTHNLIRPTKEGEPYRGVITVDSKASYSIQRSGASDKDDSNDNRGGNAAQVDELANDPGGLEILDPELVSTPSNGAKRGSSNGSSEAIVRREADKWPARKYELEYRNGRWELLTKLDAETEQSIQNAFEQAGVKL